MLCYLNRKGNADELLVYRIHSVIVRILLRHPIRFVYSNRMKGVYVLCSKKACKMGMLFCFAGSGEHRKKSRGLCTDEIDCNLVEGFSRKWSRDGLNPGEIPPPAHSVASLTCETYFDFGACQNVSFLESLKMNSDIDCAIRARFQDRIFGLKPSFSMKTKWRGPRRMVVCLKVMHITLGLI